MSLLTKAVFNCQDVIKINWAIIKYGKTLEDAKNEINKMKNYLLKNGYIIKETVNNWQTWEYNY